MLLGDEQAKFIRWARQIQMNAEL